MKPVTPFLLLAACMVVATESRAAVIGYVSQAAVGTFDTATGNVTNTKVISGDQFLTGLTYDPVTNRLLAIDGFNDANSDRLFSIDPLTGSGTIVGETGFNWNFRFLEYDAGTNTLWAGTNNQLYTLSQSTGAATLVSNVTLNGNPLLGQVTAMAINPLTSNIYLSAMMTDNNNALFSVEGSTGAATLIGTNFTTALTQWTDMAFNPTGDLFAINGIDGKVHQLNLTDGTAAAAASYNFSDFGFPPGLAFAEISAVPEPSPLTMTAIISLAGMLCRRRRVVRSQKS